MRVRDLAPQWASLSTKQLLQAVSGSTLHAVSKQIADYFNENLPMWQVLAHYGTDVHPQDHRRQVSCRLPNHGSEDLNKSARYFGVTADEPIGSIYCWTCDKAHTATWYCFEQEKYLSGYNLRETFIFIEDTFGIPFPRDLILDYDSEAELSESGTTERASLRDEFARLAHIRETLRVLDPQGHKQVIVDFHNESPSS